jgi:hypothetical protein
MGKADGTRPTATLAGDARVLFKKCRVGGFFPAGMEIKLDGDTSGDRDLSVDNSLNLSGGSIVGVRDSSGSVVGARGTLTILDGATSVTRDTMFDVDQACRGDCQIDFTTKPADNVVVRGDVSVESGTMTLNGVKSTAGSEPYVVPPPRTLDSDGNPDQMIKVDGTISLSRPTRRRRLLQGDRPQLLLDGELWIKDLQVEQGDVLVRTETVRIDQFSFTDAVLDLRVKVDDLRSRITRIDFGTIVKIDGTTTIRIHADITEDDAFKAADGSFHYPIAKYTDLLEDDATCTLEMISDAGSVENSYPCIFMATLNANRRLLQACQDGLEFSDGEVNFVTGCPDGPLSGSTTISSTESLLIASAAAMLLLY